MPLKLHLKSRHPEKLPPSCLHTKQHSECKFIINYFVLTEINISLIYFVILGNETKDTDLYEVDDDC